MQSFGSRIRAVGGKMHAAWFHLLCAHLPLLTPLRDSDLSAPWPKHCDWFGRARRQGACTTVNYAPMLSVLFLGVRLLTARLAARRGQKVESKSGLASPDLDSTFCRFWQNCLILIPLPLLLAKSFRSCIEHCIPNSKFENSLPFRDR